MEENTTKEYLKEIEPVIQALIDENEYTEDFINQINFLEEIQYKIQNMYEEWEETYFKCKFPKLHENLMKSFDDFIDELNENLGLIVQDIFSSRKRFKKHQEAEEKDNLDYLEKELKLLKKMVLDCGYEIKIIKKDCESDEPKA